MLKRLALTALVVSSLACGSGRGGVTSPPVPTRTTLFSGNFQVNPENFLPPIDVTPSSSGTVTAVLDWSFASDDLDLFAANLGCNITTGAGCTVFVQDTRKFTKPAQVSFGATAGTVYRLLVYNNGPNFETGTLNVYLDR